MGDTANGWDRPRAERRLHAEVCRAVFGGLERADVERIADAAIRETEASPVYQAQRLRASRAA